MRFVLFLIFFLLSICFRESNANSKISKDDTCVVKCVNDGDYWLNHPDDPAWTKVDGSTLCSMSYSSIIGGNSPLADSWNKLAEQYIFAALNSLNWNCAYPYPNEFISQAFFDAYSGLQDCSGDDPNWSVLEMMLSDWNDALCDGCPSLCSSD